jgi:hypothetical protein
MNSSNLLNIQQAVLGRVSPRVWRYISGLTSSVCISNRMLYRSDKRSRFYQHFISLIFAKGEYVFLFRHIPHRPRLPKPIHLFQPCLQQMIILNNCSSQCRRNLGPRTRANPRDMAPYTVSLTYIAVCSTPTPSEDDI